MRPWMPIALLLFGGLTEPVAGAAVDPGAVSAANSDGLVNVVVGLHRSPEPWIDRGAAIHARQSAVLATVPGDEVQVLHRYQSVAGLAVRASAAGLDALARDPDVAWIAADMEGSGALADSVPQIEGDRVHHRLMFGADVVVAVIDSGIDSSHPDLAGSVIHEECFCTGTCASNPGPFCRPDCCPDGSDRQSGPGSADAGHPHGTHVSGIVRSAGTIAPLGVAPDTKLVAIRTLDAGNRGSVSDWLAALDWIAANRRDVRVVNMSLASSLTFSADCADQCELDCRPQDGCDPDTVCGINRMIADVVEQLRRRGTVVVAASGNNAEDSGMSSPACVPGVVSVGAVDGEDRVAFFSNASPLLDVVAPGTDVVSTLPDAQAGQLCGFVGGQRVCGGTSAAAPHVAGTAALLIASAPGSSAEQVEDAIRDTGLQVLDLRNGRVYPRVDAFAAFRQITRVREINPAGGDGHSDCILGWNFFPPEIVQQRRRPIAVCRDGDPLCDGDGSNGVCTFLVSLCFNTTDPLLPRCDNSEAIEAIELREPAADAPAGSQERRNANNILGTLPPFPLGGTDLCTQPIPIVVSRSVDGGVAALRLRARTAQRNDSDTFYLRCDAP